MACKKVSIHINNDIKIAKGAVYVNYPKEFKTSITYKRKKIEIRNPFESIFIIIGHTATCQ